MKTLTLPKKPETATAAAAPIESAPPGSEVSGDLVLVKPTPELNPRNIVLKELAIKSNARADAEAQETIPESDEAGNIVAPAAPEAAGTTQDAAPAPEATAAPEVPQSVSEAAPAVSAAPPGIDPAAEYTFVVDGKPVKIKGTQVLSTVQKIETADARLQMATELFQKAQNQAAAGQLPDKGGVPAAPAAAPAAEVDPDALAEMIQYGTKQQAAEALKQLIAAASKPALTPDAVRSIAAQASDHQTNYREATRYVDQEYGDLLKDPYLRDLFFLKDDQARKAGDKRSYQDLWKSIGDDMRNHFNRPKPVGTSPTAAIVSTASAPVVTAAQRQAAKAAAPAAPRLASARLESGDAGAKPKSREQVIEEMRRSRGQATLTGR